MDGNRIKAWKKVFPEIDLTKSELSLEDILYIVHKFDSNLNLQNDKILNIISTFDRKYPPPRYYLIMIRKHITNIKQEAKGSKRSMVYWTSRGYSEEEAKQKVSDIQKNNSQRCISYWTSRGYSEEEAKQKVSDIQRQNAIKLHEKLKKSNHSICVWNKNFWLDRGYSEEEAKQKVSDIQRQNVKNRSSESHRINSKFCEEYWLHRGYTIDDYEAYMNTIQYKNYSKLSLEIFELVQKLFAPKNKIYFGEKEYGKYIPNVGYRKYDYIDLTTKICIEFHGSFWHSSCDVKKNDEIKKDYIISMGFRYFEIHENDWKTNKEFIIQQMEKLYETSA